ncbi:unnamed protein product, partial [Polarella glacialis]
AEMQRMRLCFGRFSDEGGEVTTYVLHDILEHLGFWTTSQELVESVSRDTTHFSTLDFNEFCEFMMRFVACEREGIQEKLNRRDTDKTENQGPLDLVQQFMHSLGVNAPRSLVKEVIVAAGLQQRRCDSPEELTRFLAAWRACEGLAWDDIEQATRIHSATEMEKHFSRVTPESRLVKVSEGKGEHGLAVNLHIQ